MPGPWHPEHFFSGLLGSTPTMDPTTTLAHATFDPKLKLYWILNGCLVLAMTLVGLPLVPLWLFFGRVFVERRFERLAAELTPRALKLRHGYLFRVEKTIPLDKIQDMSLHEGPLLRHLGLEALRVETAGQGAPQGMPDASLVGIVGARAFRDAVLARRDAVVSAGDTTRAGALERSAPEPSAGERSEPSTLVEIRDGLARIETLLRDATRRAN